MDASETHSTGGGNEAQAQHIRTVHFASVALCLALLAAWSRQSQAEYGKAIDQLHSLIGASEKIRRDPLFLDTLTKKTAEIAMRASGASNDSVLMFSWPDRQLDPTIKLTGPGELRRCVRLQIRHPYALLAPGVDVPNIGRLRLRPILTEANKPHIVPPGVPETIEQFESLWEATTKGFDVYYPTALVDSYRLLRGPQASDLEVGKWSASDSSCQDGSEQHLVCYPSLQRREGIETAGLAFRGKCDTPGTDVGFVAELEIAARTANATVDSGAALRALITPEPTAGAFKDAFAELARLSHQSRGETFSVAMDVLQESRRQASAASTHQVLGVTIPANGLWFWGMMAVLGTQWYMLALLREFAGRVRQDDAAWGVAWIGLYGNRVARWLFLGSAFWAPPLAMLYVHWHEGKDARLNPAVALVTLLLACLASCWSYECWRAAIRCRPVRQEHPEVQALDGPWRRWLALLLERTGGGPGGKPSEE